MANVNVMGVKRFCLKMANVNVMGERFCLRMANVNVGVKGFV